METSDKPREVVAVVEEDQPGVDELALANTNRVAMTRPVALDVLAMRDPKVVANYITNRISALTKIRKTALACTSGIDWVLFKNKEGQVSAMLKKSGAERVRPWYGIEVRPRGEVEILVEEGITFAVIMGDAFCPITGGVQEGIVGRRGASEDFTGRKREVAGLGDLKSAARSNLDTKAVRILCGMSSVDLSEIADAWNCTPQETERRCSRGSGYGSSAQRASGAPQRAPAASGPSPAPAQGQGAESPTPPAAGGRDRAEDVKTIGRMMRDLYGDKTDWTDFGKLITDCGAHWRQGWKWADWTAALTAESAEKIIAGLKAKLGLAEGPLPFEPPAGEPPAMREPGQEG